MFRLGDVETASGGRRGNSAERRDIELRNGAGEESLARVYEGLTVQHIAESNSARTGPSLLARVALALLCGEIAGRVVAAVFFARAGVPAADRGLLPAAAALLGVAVAAPLPVGARTVIILCFGHSYLAVVKPLVIADAIGGIALGFVLVPKHGPFGAAWATAGAYALSALVSIAAPAIARLPAARAMSRSTNE